MSWTAPADPVGGTVITTSWAISNVTNNLRWLRLMTGNADPPGSSYVPVSSGTASVAWAKVPGDALAAGAALTNLGYTPVNRAGDSAITGTLSTTGALISTNTGGSAIATSGGINSAAGVSSTLGSYTTQSGSFITTSGNITTGSGQVGGSTLAASFNGPNALVVAGDGSIGGGLTVTGRIAGNGGFGAVASNGVISTTSTLPNSIVTQGGASVALGLGVGGNLNVTGTIDGGQIRSNVGAGTGTPPLVVASSALVDNLNVLLHNGARASVTASPGFIPIADASGKLDAWVSGSGGGTISPIPAGLIMFIPDSALPTGFHFYTALNGRILAGAGTASVSNAQSFTVGVSYGTDWAHLHATNTFGVTAGGTASGGTGDNTQSASNKHSNLNVSQGPGSEEFTSDHTHNLNGVSFSVSVAGSATGNTTGAIWIPPIHALNAIRKD